MWKRISIWLDLYLIFYWTFVSIGYIFFNYKADKFQLAIGLVSAVVLAIGFLLDDVKDYYNGQKDNFGN